MDWINIYGIWAAGYACYTLGMMHAKGHTHWKNCAAALATGLLWPLALCYGIYSTHFKTPNALAQADAACGVSPGAMGSAAD